MTIATEPILTMTDQIISYPTILYQSGEFLVLNIYQDKYLIDHLAGNFKYEGEIYSLIDLRANVAEYYPSKIKDLFDRAKEDLLLLTKRNLDEAIRLDPFSGDEKGAQGIMLILVKLERPL